MSPYVWWVNCPFKGLFLSDNTEENIMNHRLCSIVPTNRVIGLYDAAGHNNSPQGHFRREIPLSALSIKVRGEPKRWKMYVFILNAAFYTLFSWILHFYKNKYKNTSLVPFSVVHLSQWRWKQSYLTVSLSGLISFKYI